MQSRPIGTVVALALVFSLAGCGGGGGSRGGSAATAAATSGTTATTTSGTTATTTTASLVIGPRDSFAGLFEVDYPAAAKNVQSTPLPARRIEYVSYPVLGFPSL